MYLKQDHTGGKLENGIFMAVEAVSDFDVADRVSKAETPMIYSDVAITFTFASGDQLYQSLLVGVWSETDPETGERYLRFDYADDTPVTGFNAKADKPASLDQLKALEEELEEGLTPTTISDAVHELLKKNEKDIFEELDRVDRVFLSRLQERNGAKLG